MQEIKKIFICAGEASGDFLAAGLVNALKKQNTNLEFHGIGGNQMRTAGVQVHIDCNKLTVLGILEVLAKLRKVRLAWKFIRNFIKKQKIDLFVLIDFSGFNLRVAKIAKNAGIKVLYYAAPQVWAWRYYRVKTIRRYVDHVAVLYPFEEKIYQNENIPVTFVGHPSADLAKPSKTRFEIFHHYQLDSTSPIITLLPGSRKREITHLLPIIMDAIQLIRNQVPDAQYVLALASHLKPQDVAEYLTPDIRIIHNDLHNVLSVSDAAIAVSGTVTLETALHQVPHAIFYKVSKITAAMVTRTLKKRIKYIGLGNLIADELLSKEFVQDDAKPEMIAAEIINLFSDPDYRQEKIQGLHKVKELLNGENASERAAKVAAALIG